MTEDKYWICILGTIDVVSCPKRLITNNSKMNVVDFQVAQCRPKHTVNVDNGDTISESEDCAKINTYILSKFIEISDVTIRSCL